MKRRVFIAIKISKPLENEIKKWSEDFIKIAGWPFDESHFSKRVNHIKWVSGKNLHITIVPPFNEENIEALAEKLKNTHGKINSFNIHFSETSLGPNPRSPCLIWAEGKTPNEILKLKDALEGELQINAGRRSFLTHITLARFRSELFSSFKIKKLNERINWNESVSSFVLMESRASPEGADYEILKEFPF